MADSQGPLHGVRVVEAATLAAGPLVSVADGKLVDAAPMRLAANVLYKASLAEGGS
ncbi:MAG: hypothetical protein ABSE98_04150 [Acidimicrobiales bacterium]|jgi:hypothetical protein